MHICQIIGDIQYIWMKSDMNNPLDVLKSLLVLGCREDEAEVALKVNNNDLNTALDFILQSSLLQQEVFNSLKERQRMLGFIPKDFALNDKASASARESDAGTELANPEKRRRDKGVPVGLKSMGSTCYLNCLLQAYFMLPLFVKRVFEFKGCEEEKAAEAQAEGKSKGRTLMGSLQSLFARLVLSEKRCIEPTEVFKSLADAGGCFSAGEQKDVSEFNAFFLSAVGKALEESSESLKVSGREPVEAGKSFESDFSGEFSVVTRALEKDGREVCLSETKEFMQVTVSAKEKDLYAGWEASYFNAEIEGFRTPEGHETKAEQEWWVTRLPSVLFLAVQRCSYDAASGSVKKVDCPVQFDRVVYLDRFMLENQQESRAARAEVRKCKSKIKELETALEKYKEFGASKLDIEKVLETSLYFLTNQSEHMGSEEAKDAKAFSPTEIGSLGHSPAQFKELAEVISQYSKAISDRVKEMKEQLAYYNAKVANSYDNMKKHPYNLHSVIVHAGNPENGHYFAYVQDEGRSKWRRYSDTQVAEVSDAEVMAVSAGTQRGSVSAYCLVYVADSQLLPPRQILNSSSDKSVDVLDYYASMLPCKLRQEVVKENEEFRMEVARYRAEKVVEKLEKLYVARCEELRELDAGVVPESVFRTFSFVSYLKAEASPHVRWELMNCTLKELHSSIGIMQLEKDDPIFVRLEKHFLGEYKNAPENLLLSESEFKQLDIIRNTFENEVTEYAIRDYLLKELLEKHWAEAYKTICYYLDNKLHKIDNVKMDITDIAKMLLLILSGEISKFFMKKEVRSAINYVRMSSNLCTSVIGVSDLHSQFAMLRLKKVRNEVRISLFTSEEFILLNQYIRHIEENDQSVKECHEEPKKLKIAIEKEVKKGFEWRGGWKRMEEEWKLKQERRPKFAKENGMWMEIHEKLNEGVEVTVEETYEREKAIGIDFKLP